MLTCKCNEWGFLEQFNELSQVMPTSVQTSLVLTQLQHMGWVDCGLNVCIAFQLYLASISHFCINLVKISLCFPARLSCFPSALVPTFPHIYFSFHAPKSTGRDFVHVTSVAELFLAGTCDQILSAMTLGAQS